MTFCSSCVREAIQCPAVETANANQVSECGNNSVFTPARRVQVEGASVFVSAAAAAATCTVTCCHLHREPGAAAVDDEADSELPSICRILPAAGATDNLPKFSTKIKHPPACIR
jgi:hypothetical protein